MALVEQERERGIYLTVLGVGSGNLNDSMMEQLADNGNGNYEYIDNLAQLEKIFIHERSRFHTVARDCKVQVTFDPKAVAAYRLIGYENRLMDDEEFENDNRDAGEIGAGQSVTVLYEIVPTANGKETLASFDVRYKKEAGSTGIPLSENVRTGTAPITEASDDMRFAAAVAGFGMLLKQSEYAGSANKAMVRELAGKRPARIPGRICLAGRTGGYQITRPEAHRRRIRRTKGGMAENHAALFHRSCTGKVSHPPHSS